MAITKAIKAIAKQLFANPKNYGNKRSLKSIKYIVIHYTANDGDTDEANALCPGKECFGEMIK